MIHPMLLADAPEPFESKAHIAELKIDGIRGILEVEEQVRLYTRHQNDVSYRYQEITQAAAQATGKGTTLDGEFVVCDITTGKPDFEATMARFSSNPKPGIDRTPGLTYVAFDILQYKGKDLTKLNLMQRKEILEEAVTENEVIKKIRYMEHGFIPLFELCKQQQLEGIVIKRRDSRYYPGKRPEHLWQRVVVYQREQCVVLGYSKREIAWLIGVEIDGVITSVGMLKYGITPSVRKEVFPILKKTTIRETKDFAYVDPTIKIDVRYRHWTKQNKMRLAVLERVHQ
ncbi:DNA ligase [Paenibacillus sp. LC231]|uniref:ATP-dependent DNA ligase n=1 Tax=Paenibacillus sp. LC231 TaxID=1120679 RepID=UPI0013923BCB|nr:DNA ligase [Paenibacillus sp. LC231]